MAITDSSRRRRYPEECHEHVVGELDVLLDMLWSSQGRPVLLWESASCDRDCVFRDLDTASTTTARP